MRLLVSAENPAGHCLVARLPHDARIQAQFFDEDSPRDVTDFVCDLMLMGLHSRYETTQGLASPPVEAVEVASLSVAGSALEDVSFIYAHPATGMVREFNWATGSTLLSEGISYQITTGVAHEAADVPDSPETLEVPPGA